MRAFMIRKTLQINAKEAFEVEILRPPFCSTFCSTGKGNILPFFAFRRKRKTPDFVWKSGVCSDLLFLKVVPPAPLFSLSCLFLLYQYFHIILVIIYLYKISNNIRLNRNKKCSINVASIIIITTFAM